MTLYNKSITHAHCTGVPGIHLFKNPNVFSKVPILETIFKKLVSIFDSYEFCFLFWPNVWLSEKGIFASCTQFSYLNLFNESVNILYSENNFKIIAILMILITYVHHNIWYFRKKLSLFHLVVYKQKTFGYPCQYVQ